MPKAYQFRPPEQMFASEMKKPNLFQIFRANAGASAISSFGFGPQAFRSTAASPKFATVCALTPRFLPTTLKASGEKP
ncbi:hypothetical protein PZN02_003242 [Sinorhizobium garamanticum]|uniref:Uncharacterized protein n=1 Tax=Sinorhizobium garamanticum TaxID=680247 RepID=A0ABY8DBJ5_9HYPH|nr:hypothetical protein [Sinorhizobium garamanticum]WEX86905.1 hypothetical protein PZN02_003242 [Sinorhizobium garamanticum]